MAGPGGIINLTNGNDTFPVIGDDNSGDETVNGLAGIDIISGGLGNDTLNGDGGDDVLRDDGGTSTTMNGGADNDFLIIGNILTSATVSGGTGDDTVALLFTEPETFTFNLASGSLAGGAGTDTLSIGSNPNVLNVEVDLSALTVSGFEILNTSFPLNIVKATAAQFEQFDTIGDPVTVIQVTLNIADIGAPQFLDLADELNSGGNPRALGTIGGNDNLTITAGDAHDQLNGGNGTDVLNGGIGHDRLNGSLGNDTLKGGLGDDTLEGSTGTDTVDYSDATGAVTVNLAVVTAQAIGGGLGVDALSGIENFVGSNFNDRIIGNNSVNVLSGGAGNDSYSTAGAGDVVVEGFNQGFDTLFSYVNVAALAANVERLFVYGSATSGTGNGLANDLFANGAIFGATLDGAAGNDTLIGSDQSDVLIGGAGNDRLAGYAGANQMQGGADDDAYYSRSASDVVTEGFNQGDDILYSTVNVTALAANVERLFIYGGATSGTGNGLANTLYGNASALAVTLNGAAGNDTLIGSDQSGDVLIGGANDDILNGRSGNDRFRFAAAGTGADRIIGFDAIATGGQDLIDVSGRGFNAGSIGTTILISASGADTLITIGADTIRLQGVGSANVTAADFVF